MESLKIDFELTNRNKQCLPNGNSLFSVVHWMMLQGFFASVCIARHCSYLDVFCVFIFFLLFNWSKVNVQSHCRWF